MQLSNSRTHTDVTNASLHLHEGDTIKKEAYHGAFWVEATGKGGTMGVFVHSHNLEQVREFAAALLQTAYTVESLDK